MSKQFVAIGKLRRELMIVGSGDKDEVTSIAEAACAEGRASEVFVIAVAGHFTETEHAWANPDRVGNMDSFVVGTRGGQVALSSVSDAPATTGALNPAHGPQPKTEAELAKEDAKLQEHGETLAGNIAARNVDGPKVEAAAGVNEAAKAAGVDKPADKPKAAS